MKPEHVEEIQAVAARLHLSAETVATLSRWSDVAQDLMAIAYQQASNKAEYDAAQRRAYIIGEAQRKAEIRLLGGYDNWSRFYRLKGFVRSGLLDTVDNEGNPLHPGPNKGDPVVIHDHFADAVVDTTPYESYFK